MIPRVPRTAPLRGGARTAALALAGALALGGIAGCAGEPDDRGATPVTELPAAESGLPAALGPPIDEALMVPLAQARNHHHKADVLLEEAHLPEAIAALRPILAIRFPAGAPEGEDVVLDARARIAKLLIRSGARKDIDEALAVVDQGLASASRPSFFLANLYTARGEVLEASARAYDARVDDAAPAAARAARRAAIEAFDRSIAINEALMTRLDEDAR